MGAATLERGYILWAKYLVREKIITVFIFLVDLSLNTTGFSAVKGRLIFYTYLKSALSRLLNY